MWSVHGFLPGVLACVCVSSMPTRMHVRSCVHVHCCVGICALFWTQIYLGLPVQRICRANEEHLEMQAKIDERQKVFSQNMPETPWERFGIHRCNKKIWYHEAVFCHKNGHGSKLRLTTSLHRRAQIRFPVLSHTFCFPDGSTNVHVLSEGGVVPAHFAESAVFRKLCAKHDHIDDEWKLYAHTSSGNSSSFHDLGSWVTEQDAIASKFTR